jgi:hypothetical protein
MIFFSSFKAHGITFLTLMILFFTLPIQAQDCTCNTSNTLGTPNTTTTFEDLVTLGLLPANGASQNLTYCIEGTLVIETGDPIPGSQYNFQTCNLVMGTDASIEVESGMRLRIADCDIYSCTDLWNSITIQHGAQLTLRESDISDAHTAFIIEGGERLEFVTTNSLTTT